MLRPSWNGEALIGDECFGLGIGRGGTGPASDCVFSGSGVDTGVFVPDSSLDEKELVSVCLLPGWIGAGPGEGGVKYLADGEGGYTSDIVAGAPILSALSA